MAAHSITPTWRIPWTEAPGGLQSMGWQRAGHDWAHYNTYITTEHHCLGGLNNNHVFLTFLEAGKSKIKVPARWVSGEKLLPCLKAVAPFVCVHRVERERGESLVSFFWVKKQSFSLSVMSDSLQPHGLELARLLCSWDSPYKYTGMGSHSLLQGIFPTQESNPGLLYWQADSLLSEPPGKPFEQGSNMGLLHWELSISHWTAGEVSPMKLSLESMWHNAGREREWSRALGLQETSREELLGVLVHSGPLLFLSQ